MFDTTTLPSAHAPTRTASPTAPRATAEPPPTRAHLRVLAGLALWALLATIATAAGLLYRLPPFVVPATLLGTTGAFALLYARAPALRAWAHGVDARALIAPHVLRAPIGAWFLVMLAQGRLPAEFAVRAGYGDIVAGLLAPLALLAAARLASPARRRVVFAWNAIALADIAMVVVTAQKLVLLDRDPRMVGALGRLPWALLPTFFVPVVLITHALVFARLRRESRRARG